MSDASEVDEKFVRLTVPWQKGGGKLPPPFLNWLAVDSTRDELSRLDHFEHMLEMVPVEAKSGKRVVSASNNLALQAPVEILSAPQSKPGKGKKA